MAFRLHDAKTMNQRWNIVNWTLGENLQWNVNQNVDIFIQENAFEIVVSKLAGILSRLLCINGQMYWAHKIVAEYRPKTHIPRNMC